MSAVTTAAEVLSPRGCLQRASIYAQDAAAFGETEVDADAEAEAGGAEVKEEVTVVQLKPCCMHWDKL
jgi:hypothetical protein